MSWGKGAGRSNQTIQANPVVEMATMNALNAAERMLGLRGFQDYAGASLGPAPGQVGSDGSVGGFEPTGGALGDISQIYDLYNSGAIGGSDTPSTGRSGTGLIAEGADPNLADTRGIPVTFDSLGTGYEAGTEPMPGLPETPGFFPGETLAGMSPLREQALGSLFSRGAMGSAPEASMEQYLTQTLNNPMANPLTSQMFGQAAGDMTEVFNEQILPGINATFAGAGRTGSGLQADALGNAAGELTDSLQGLAANMFGGAAESALGRQMQAAGLVPQASGLDYQNLSAMEQAGLGFENQRQREIDAARERYEYESSRPLQDFQRGQDALNQYIGLTGPLHGTGTTAGTNSMKNIGSKK